MSTVPVISPKKLIEVALPLDAINEAAAYEKSIRHGHPSTLHLWWARRPLAAARAVLFGQLVHDPEDLWLTQNPGVEPNKQNRGHWTRERARLFRIIEDLVKWENTTNEQVLEPARAEIRRSWKITCELNRHHPQAAQLFNPVKMPGLHDPFAGGGAIPLEAQRLGLEAYASDLNPVAVLINMAMIQIPPRFAGRSPVHPRATNPLRVWKGAASLAEDVRHYGNWMREEAARRIGNLYPRIVVTPQMASDRPDLKPYVGQSLTVIAWLWARTVKSPSPAFSHVDVPLASSFQLASKPGKDVYLEPVVQGGKYHFAIRRGRTPAELRYGTKAGLRSAFRCIMSDAPIDYDYIRDQAQSGKMGQRLMAVVAEGRRERVYLPAQSEHVVVAQSAAPLWQPDLRIVPGMSERVVRYGMEAYSDLFTSRQMAVLATLSELVPAARAKVLEDALLAGFSKDPTPLEQGGSGAVAYADAVSLYLAFAVDKVANYSSTVCTWHSGVKYETVTSTFGRQAIPMTWDFAESNPFSTSSGNWVSGIEWIADIMDSLPGAGSGLAFQANASHIAIHERVVSTDPPYYDNIGYADLSDFFYVWLRHSLRDVFKGLLTTMSVPKEEELIAAPHRHGSHTEAEQFFLAGMTSAMANLASQAQPAYPVTLYYAFKQSETGGEGTNSTGWETFLEAVLRAGFAITGTWPMKTELVGNLKKAKNALASSIVLVCRPRAVNAGAISRRQFIRMLNERLPIALDAMTRQSEGEHSPVAPVDLSQAIIGPGMAIFSRYEAVLEADGTPMTVKTALQLINRFLAEDDFDADTQFCLHWFDQHGWETGKFGEADTLARAKGTSVDGVKQSGVVEAGGGNVRLLRWKDYPAEWDARSDSRLPVWEALHQLIRAYQTEGDAGASKVLAAVASKAETSRQLAYRLYTLCERKGWAEDARAYNEVVTGWSSIETAAAKIPGPSQGILFDATKEKA
jgi:putative DNA methylase